MKQLFTILLMIGVLSLGVELNAQNNEEAYPDRMLGLGVAPLLENIHTTVRYQTKNWFFDMEIGGSRFQRDFDLDDFELSETFSQLGGDQDRTSWNYTFELRATRVKWFDLGSRLSLYLGGGAGLGSAQSFSSAFTEILVFPDSSFSTYTENKVNSLYATISAVGGAQYKLGKRFSLTAEIDGLRGQTTWTKNDRLIVSRQFTANNVPSGVDVSQDDFPIRRTSFTLFSGGRLIIGYHF